jgi:hypothetical protein
VAPFVLVERVHNVVPVDENFDTLFVPWLAV